MKRLVVTSPVLFLFAAAIAAGALGSVSGQGNEPGSGFYRDETGGVVYVIKGSAPTTPSGTTPPFGHPSSDKEGSAAATRPLAGGEPEKRRTGIEVRRGQKK